VRHFPGGKGRVLKQSALPPGGPKHARSPQTPVQLERAGKKRNEFHAERGDVKRTSFGGENRRDTASSPLKTPTGKRSPEIPAGKLPSARKGGKDLTRKGECFPPF